MVTWRSECPSDFTCWNREAIGGESDEPNGAGYAALYASGVTGRPAGTWSDYDDYLLLQCACSSSNFTLLASDQCTGKAAGLTSNYCSKVASTGRRCADELYFVFGIVLIQAALVSHAAWCGSK